MLGAGHSIAALSSGEVPAPAAAPVGVVASDLKVPSPSFDSSIGTRLNALA